MPSPLHALLTARAPTTFDSLDAWWTHHVAAVRGEALPIDEALLGGADADRAAYAFAAGYQAALRALVPSLPRDAMASLCATEQGGAHPKNIRTTLAARADGGL